MKPAVRTFAVNLTGDAPRPKEESKKAKITVSDNLSKIFMLIVVNNSSSKMQAVADFQINQPCRKNSFKYTCWNDKKEGKNENDWSVCENSFITLMRVFYTALYICIKKNDHESAIEKIKPNRLPG
jgi:ribosomal silencing factor RsfS